LRAGILFIILLAGVAIGVILTPKKDKAYEQQIEALKEQAQNEVERLTAESSKLRIQLAEADRRYMVSKDSVTLLRASTEKWQQRYEYIKKNRVDRRVSDAGLDSAVTRFLAAH